MSESLDSQSVEPGQEQQHNPTGVKRIGKLPWVIVVAVFGGVMGILAVSGAFRGRINNTQVAGFSVKDYQSSEDAVEAMAQSAPKAGLAPTAGASGYLVNNGEKPPLEASIVQSKEFEAKDNTSFGENGNRFVNAAENQIDQIKLQKFQQAVTAKTTVQMQNVSWNQGGNLSRDEMLEKIDRVKKEISNQKSEDPTVAYLDGMKKIKNSLDGASNEEEKPAAQMEGSAIKPDRWALNSQVKENKKFSLLAGTVLPATLISGINSELPGQIMAQVSQSVYDTATGKYLLIPQGSKLVGRYDSNVAYGQSRVLISWQRLSFPNGKTLDIGEMPGADGQGYSGFADEVDNHYLRIFGSALFLSGITAGIASTQNRNNSMIQSQPTMSGELSQALGQQFGQVAIQMIAKNMNIAPTIKIRPGFRFNVIATKDIVFSKKYQ